jgi:site-specific recombinase XerD
MSQHLPPTIKQWLTFLIEDGKSSHTYEAYKRGVTHFLDWHTTLYEASFKPQQVMPRDIRDWQAHQQKVERSAPATTNQRLSAVKQFFKWAQQQEIITINPTDNTSTVRIDQREIKSLKPHELRRLLRAAKSHRRDFAILEVLGGTGIRVSELLDLCIGDVVINARSGKLTVRYGKGGGYRDIPLTYDVRQAVQGYLEHDHLMPNDDRQKLWWGRDDALRHRSSITRILEKYAIHAGLGKVTPHTLRHTFATRYLNANPDDLRGLARLLGHSSLNTVMIYTEPTFSDLDRRLERMEVHVE